MMSNFLYLQNINAYSFGENDKLYVVVPLHVTKMAYKICILFQ
jgi:hypothetical protein